ncbi:MAG TPA: hypothetical protein VGF68_10860 [Solirubrobacteraceae bacterium]
MRPHTPIFHHIRIPLALVAVNVAFAAAFIGTALSAFHEPTPHSVPLAIVAPARITHEVRGVLATRAPGGFDLHAYPNEASAKHAIASRAVDGGLVATPRGMILLVARAGGSAPAQLLTNTFDGLAARTGQRLTVVDAVPPLKNDSLALSSFFTILCVLFPSLATGAATAHLFRRHRTAWRIAVPAVAAVAIGLSAAAVASGITGFDDYLPVAGIVALFSLAISAPTAALGRIKLPLIALAVITFLIIGLPVSGGPSGLGSFGPGFLRALDSALPLGVAADTVRNTVYFHGSDTAGHLWVLGGWAAAGIALLLAHPARARLRTAYLQLRTQPAR